MFPKNLTPAASRKLWDIFSKAELEYQFKGTPIARSLRREANRQLGQTKKILLQVAAMGEFANAWMVEFIKQISFAAALCIIGSLIGAFTVIIVVKVIYINPCEKELPRNMHCELTTKIAVDKHE